MSINNQSLFNEAENLRNSLDFDEAQECYKKILAEETNNAAAYWGLLLCDYGIKYVIEDGKGKATINRSCKQPILENYNYLKALELADPDQKRYYESEAKQIAVAHAHFLELEQLEETYDVFISYKETDSNGKKTEDFRIAEKIYNELTADGFKVFYSHITLEKKAGARFEPCIHAALEHSKVMLVLATKLEYFNSPWVNYEWTSFYNLIRHGHAKTLIPIITNDIVVSKMPQELRERQALGLNNWYSLAAISRRIINILRKDNSQPDNLAAKKIDLAFCELDNKKYRRAIVLFKEVLKTDPYNGKACLGKLLADLHVSSIDDLRSLKESIALEKVKIFIKAFKYLDDQECDLLANIANERLEHRKGYDAKIARRKKYTFITVLTLFVLGAIGYFALNRINYYQNSFEDARDGQRYRTVKIANKIWMAENLRFVAPNESQEDASNETNKPQDVYSYKMAINDICPAGWYLPTEYDYKLLREQLLENKELVEFFTVEKENSEENNKSGTVLANKSAFWGYGYDNTKAAFEVIDKNNIIVTSGKEFEDELLRSVRCFKWDNPKLIVEAGEFTDTRDGEKYKTTKIGNQIWMAENLRYAKGNPIPQSAYCNEDDDKKYGLFYNLDATSDICPEGWHVPSKDDFQELLDTIDGTGISLFGILADGNSDSSWPVWAGHADNSVGFNALPTPSFKVRCEHKDMTSASYISSTVYNSLLKWSLEISGSGVEIIPNKNEKQKYYQVRCLQGLDSPTIQKIEKSHFDSFTDINDKNVYKTIQIGDQIWMAENVRYNGSSCPNKNDSINPPNNDEDKIEQFSYLYNWECASKICPEKEGWRLPSKEDFEELIKYVESTIPNYDLYAALMTKSNEWDEGRNRRDDLFGFGALSAGWEDKKGIFEQFSKAAYFWSSTKYDGPENTDPEYYYFQLHPEAYSKEQRAVIIDKVDYRSNMSVRCIKK